MRKILAEYFKRISNSDLYLHLIPKTVTTDVQQSLAKGYRCANTIKLQLWKQYKMVGSALENANVPVTGYRFQKSNT